MIPVRNKKKNSNQDSLCIGFLLDRQIMKNLGWVLGFIFFIFFPIVLANPEGGVVTSGNAIITSPAPDTVQINQASDKAIINWHSFNIESHEKTHFQQSSTNSITLNRIDPNQGASAIYGQLSANGKIILVNQAGVYFGPTARVDVSGLIASTVNMTDENFIAGKYIFDQHSLYNGSIINNGEIIAENHGLVALVGSNIENNGIIHAHLGNVILASGNTFVIDFYGDQLINFIIQQPIDNNITKHAVRNTGTILADGGTILITAKAANAMLDTIINMQGILEARSVKEKHGEIILLSENEGTVYTSGKIDVSGKQSNESGGKIKILGNKILIDDSSVLDASGTSGGGEILIGGDYQGKNPSILNADYTFISRNSNIYADALNKNNGGKIIIWANKHTYFDGNIFARGGAETGDGGFVEVSGKENLSFLGNVHLQAQHGKNGSLLLDPTDLYIIDGADGTGDQDAFFTGATLGFSVPDSASNTISVGKLQSLGDVDILLQARNSLTVGAADGTLATVDLTPSLFSSTLTLQAGNTSTLGGGNIIFNPGSSIFTGGGNVTLIAGDATIQHTGNAVLGDISTVGGNISVTAQQNATVNGIIDSQTGSTTITANTGVLTINQNISSAINTISLTGAGIVQAADTVMNSGPGSLTLNAGANAITTNSGSQLLSTGTLTLIANTMSLSTLGGAQIGGDTSGTNTDFAANAILHGTNGTTIGVAGGAGTLSLPANILATIRANNARIGDNNAGAITIGTWTPTATFARNGALTLASANGITQTGALNLSTSASSLLLRRSSGVTLTNSGNIINSVAATISGMLMITNAPTRPLTVTGVTDDLGTVNGITAPGGVTLTSSGTGGLLRVNQNVSSTNNPISLSGTGINQAINTIVNSGTGKLTLNAGANTITTGSGSRLLTTGTLELSGNAMLFSIAGAVQIGGDGSGTATDFASNVILREGTTGTTIGIAGAPGTLALTAARLNLIHATNVRIGDSNAGAIRIGTWSPASTFSQNGTLTLDSSSTITQTGALNLAASNSGLLLRDSTGVTLTSNNVVNALAANINGALSLTNASGNPLTIASLSNDLGTVNGVTANGVTLNAPNSIITLNSTITSLISGNSISLASQIFTNNAGSSALHPGTGYFLVWSENPANDNRGGLVYQFKQYNATFGTTTAAQAHNGFLYTITPLITPSLTGTISKSYDGTTTASLTNGNYLVSGTVDGDAVTISNPASGTYATPNVGTALNVAVSGISLTSTVNGSATVYGYQSLSTANGNIGTITPLTLTYHANPDSMTYGATVPTFSGTVTGFLNGENLATATTGTPLFTTLATSTNNVGSYQVTGSGLTANNGNYVFAQDTGNNSALTINPAVLIYSANPVSIAYGSTLPTLSGSVTGFVNGENLASATSGTLLFTTSATSTNNAGNYLISGSGLTANNGNYIFTQALGNNTALTISPPVSSGGIIPPVTTEEITSSVVPSTGNISAANLSEGEKNVIVKNSYYNAPLQIQNTTIQNPEISILMPAENQASVLVNTIASTQHRASVQPYENGIEITPVYLTRPTYVASFPVLIGTTIPSFVNDISTIEKFKPSQTTIEIMIISLSALILLNALWMTYPILAAKEDSSRSINITFRLRTALDSINGFIWILSQDTNLQFDTNQKYYLDHILFDTNNALRSIRKIEAENTEIGTINFELRTALNNVVGFTNLINKYIEKKHPSNDSIMIHKILSDGTKEIFQALSLAQR